jgi:D-tyrosyl-tRNA(Tyr) deacylase
LRALLQRVAEARVRVGGKTVSEIGPGLLVFVGIAPFDGPQAAKRMAQKVVALRIFEDEAGKMNRSVVDTGGGILIVSQFTLYADTKKGNRPSFTGAAPSDHANGLYELFAEEVRKLHRGDVRMGIFGADMRVSLVNDGPVTILLDSEEGA